MNCSRRKCIAAAGTAMSLSVMPRLLPAAETSKASSQGQELTIVATNTYPWLTFARRAGEPFELHTDALLAKIAATGVNGYEPIIEDVAEFEGLGTKLKQHGLSMKSIYVNSTLHEMGKAEQSVAEVVEISKAARAIGTQIVVTNPSPIRWGGPEDKTDQQLRVQAKTLDQLGAELKGIGMTLAYHNHDAELRQGGREFHHMLTATDPSNVKLCLDAHWVFRGCGDSEVAVFDALTHYHQRIVELHLRQSVDGVWTEDFRMRGDIDYAKLFGFLKREGIVPHLVLEQAVEEKSPNKMSVVEAHRIGHDHLRKFG